MLHTGEATYAVPKHVTTELTGDRDKGHPDLRVECSMVGGQPLVQEVHLIASPNGRALRDADLAALALDKIALRAFMDHATVVDPLWEGGGHRASSPLTYHRAAHQLVEDFADALKGEQAGGSTAPALVELERVAEVYRENAHRAPRAQVIAVLGYSPRTADRRIKAAQDAGLLTPGRRGKRRSSPGRPD